MPEQAVSRAPLRMRLALIIISVVGALLAARLFYWQIIQWDKLSRLAERQSRVDVSVPSRRGDIRTRDDLRVATDVFLFTITASPDGIPDHDKLASQLAPILKQPRDAILAKLNSKNGDVVLARDVPLDIGGPVQDLKMRLESKQPELGLANLQIHVKTVRQYPAGPFAAQVIGYVNLQRQPAYGIEQFKDADLRGTNGKILGAGDALHDLIPIDLPTNEPPIDGASVTLTLNSGMQRVAETELANAIRDTRATSGSIIIWTPRPGRFWQWRFLPPPT